MQYLCPVSEVLPESGKEVVLESSGQRFFIALFSTEAGVRAYLNSCPHQGRSLNWGPDQFLFTPEGDLVCPHHGASFKTESGRCVSGPCAGASLKPVDIEIRGEAVYGRVSDAQA